MLLVCPPDAHPGALISAAALNVAAGSKDSRCLVFCRETWALCPKGQILPQGQGLEPSRVSSADADAAASRVEFRYVRDDRDLCLCLAHAHVLPYVPRALVVPDLGRLMVRHRGAEKKAAAVHRLLALLLDTADHFTKVSPDGKVCRVYVSLEADTSTTSETRDRDTSHFHDTEFLCRRFLPSVVLAHRRPTGCVLGVAAVPPGSDQGALRESLPYDVDIR